MRTVENRPVQAIAIVYERATGKAVQAFLQETEAIVRCQQLNRAQVEDPIYGDELSLEIPDVYTWRMFRCMADELIFDEIVP